MKELLFLSHRIPYPPVKGDKIRSYHLLRFLSRRFRIHLGTFIDYPEDWEHVPALKEMIHGQSMILGLNRTVAKIRSLRGFLTGAPLTFPYYADSRMRRWVDEILETRPISHVVVYSAGPAPFVMGKNAARTCRIMDFVDIDSAKWRQYAEESRFFKSWIFKREAEKLLAAERRIAATFDCSMFVSEVEAELFKSLDTESAEKIDYWENGVDRQHFSPDVDHPNPYPADQIPLVFTGAMDYRPNIDAVIWFAGEILPLIRHRVEKCCFIIAGGGATPDVVALDKLPGVTVTGQVADMRPYIAHAAVAVVPLRLARGIQNKVLEAMALARPVVATSQAMEGIRVTRDMEEWIADDAAGFADLVVRLLGENREPGAPDTETAKNAARSGYELILAKYDWDENLQRVADVLQPDASC